MEKCVSEWEFHVSGGWKEGNEVNFLGMKNMGVTQDCLCTFFDNVYLSNLLFVLLIKFKYKIFYDSPHIFKQSILFKYTNWIMMVLIY
jgi:hypothetical protein